MSFFKKNWLIIKKIGYGGARLPGGWEPLMRQHKTPEDGALRGSLHYSVDILLAAHSLFLQGLALISPLLSASP